MQTTLSAEWVNESISVNDATYVSKRPSLEKRAFVSSTVERKLDEVVAKIADDKLKWMFINCFPNTLDTTVKFKMRDGYPDTFVITGDINAMWLRDSSAQVQNYLSLAAEDEALREMIKGLINRQLDCILLDPYANAFNDGPTASGWQTDATEMRKEVNERKWEIDSLCYPIRLIYQYWKATGDDSVFNAKWEKAMALILKTFQEQQRKENDGPYSFERHTGNAIGTLVNRTGNPVNPVGMVVSCFRPSDDATIFGFLVPSNMFIVASMRQLSEIIRTTGNGKNLLNQTERLKKEVDEAIQKYGIVNHPVFGKIYAYEVDGYGGCNLMDDANNPSLLSVPYFGYVNADDPVYQNTRKFVWSKHNPYFFKGTVAEGIGGPHCGKDKIWPMSIISKALTSEDKEEIAECLRVLVNTDGNTGFIHESFHKDNPADFSRGWFAWANTLFAELVLKISEKYPELLLESYTE
ncbi:glycoside hydrolase family 125 protein [Phocaeicola barnesiae]|uniref:Glycoside hydrolase family 125 protein n=2 Tax=Phocaeicola barnesiae TaxID=376804 RepID=A0AAW5N4T3_9BACT|nr:glycoside hydrolase family 125 protein [Phocaeicola barnesiae]MCR8873052.1 glycoside hydrolase family 125 protein [Phocaeicola barnesiae]MDM8233557.1 glycoside hydrolase family 125 protein [Phocaeicola barnesiae]